MAVSSLKVGTWQKATMSKNSPCPKPLMSEAGATAFCSHVA